MPQASVTASSRNAGRPSGHARQSLMQALHGCSIEGDFATLARLAGLQPRQAQQTLLSLRREGAVEPCGAVPTGGRPRHVWRATQEPAHQYLARTLLDSWR